MSAGESRSVLPLGASWLGGLLGRDPLILDCQLGQDDPLLDLTKELDHPI
jgi:hypothetical protein